MAMAIIQFCCCWSTLRSGCYASAFYTMVYFTVTITMVTIFGVAEGDPEAAGFGEQQKGSSATNPGEDLETLKILNICVVTLSAMGLVSTFFLLYGLAKNRSSFLLPWIVIVSCTTAVDLIYAIYLLIHMESLNPISAMIFTCDFVLVIVNVYCILCVVSQYQELSGNTSAQPQTEALAVSGDLFETNNSSQPPLEEIKLGEITDSSNPQRRHPELDAVCGEALWTGCHHPDNQLRILTEAYVWLEKDEANGQQSDDSQRRVTFQSGRSTVTS